MMNITMPRGDIRPVSFTINRVSGEDVPELDNIYFTVKKNFKVPEVLLQKTLSSGLIEKIDNNKYQFIIEPEDTNGLNYGSYVFDIELVSESSHIKQTFLGEFIITQEVTFSANEV